MPKNGKNNIDPKAVGDVRYYNGDRGGDELLTSTLRGRAISDFCFTKTNENTQYMPDGISDAEKKGMLLSTISKWDTKDGSQTFFSDEGKIFRRSFKNAGVNFGNWAELSTRNTAELLKKPEYNKLNSSQNIDNISTSGIYSVNEAQGTYPQGFGLSDKWGILHHYNENLDRNTTRMQVFYCCSGPKKGNMYSRLKRTDTNSGNWTPWEYIDFRGESFIKKSESQNEVTDVNAIKYTSMLKTGASTTRGDLPNNGGTTKWGVLITFMQNTSSSSEAGYQIWSSVTGSASNKLWLRTINGGRWSSWNEIGARGPAGPAGPQGPQGPAGQTPDLSNVFKHPSQVITSLSNASTGYYLTDSTSSSILPADIKDPQSHNGILKVIVKDNKKILQYTPYEGEQAGREYIGTSSVTRIRPDWNTYSKPGQVQIHEDYRGQVISPLEYEQAEKTDAVVFEIKLPAFLGGTHAYPDSSATSTILQTNVVTTEHHIGEPRRVGFISQVATSFPGGRMFRRHAQKRGESSNWDEWSQWTELGTGFKMPESDSITDANHVLFSGVYRTSHPSTQNLPSPASQNKNGFLTHYKYNSNLDGSAVQYWTTFTGTAKGKFFTRYKENSQSWSPWVEIGAGGGSGSGYTEDQIREWIRDEINKMFNTWATSHQSRP